MIISLFEITIAYGRAGSALPLNFDVQWQACCLLATGHQEEVYLFGDADTMKNIEYNTLTESLSRCGRFSMLSAV
jgi:hypothetical protein